MELTPSFIAYVTHCERLANEWLNKLSLTHYHVIAAWKGFRNGIVYGVRIRAPHAFVMMMLFGRGTLLQRLKNVFQMTFQHAWNLGRFVLGYKTLMGIMRKRFFLNENLQLEIGRFKQWHPFVSAFIVGYFVFGKENGINTQINLYLLSRIIYGLLKLSVERRIIFKTNFNLFPWFSAFVWGIILWLFENHEHVLQKSLKSSMTYLYHDSNYWTNIKNFVFGN